MKRIIVPTDFSSGAWNAFVYAMDLAQTLNVNQLLVLNSYYEPHSGAATMLSIQELMKKESEKELDLWRRKIEEKGYDRLLNIQYKSLHAHLLGALNSQLIEPGQLIVMGTLGETGALEELIGSNASSVISKVNCPVLVIPPDGRFSFSGKLLLAGDTEKLPEHIDTDVLKAFCDYHTNSLLEVVQVVDNGESYDQKAFEGLLEGIQYESRSLVGENVAQVLDDHIASQPIDILVLLKVKRSLLDKLFHKSITKKLVLHAQIPILVLKESETKV